MFAVPIAAQESWSILGARSGRDRAVVAIGAMHPFEAQFPELEGRSGMGVHWRGWFAATFINSYGRRAFSGGLERSWFTLERGPLGLGAGYRVGAVTSYDERLFALAGHTPILPYIGALVWGDVGPLALDAFYVYRAITVEVAVRF